MRFITIALKYRPWIHNLHLKRSYTNKALSDLVQYMAHELSCKKPKVLDMDKIYFTSRLYLEVLGNGSCKSNSLVYFTDSFRILFNCGDNTQRLASEFGMKTKRCTSVFVTSLCWENIGGILGWALTLQSVGVTEATIYGPPGIEHLFASIKQFMMLKKLHLNIIPLNTTENLVSNGLQIKVVPLNIKPGNYLHKNISDPVVNNLSTVSESEDETEEENCTVILHKQVKNKSKIRNKRRSQSEAREMELANSNKKVSLIYVVTTPEMGGTLNFEACLNLGVPVGPLLGKLKNKEDVVLDNGKLIKWKDVVYNVVKPITIIVVDCPNEQYLDSLVNEPTFLDDFNSKADISVVVHFSSNQVMETSQYQNWMMKFPLTTKHLKINSSNTIVSPIHFHQLQKMLNIACPILFPNLAINNVPVLKDEFSGKFKRGSVCVAVDFTSEEVTPKDVVYETHKHSVMYMSGICSDSLEILKDMNGIQIFCAMLTLRLLIYPNKKPCCSHRLALDPKEYVRDLMTRENVETELATLQNFVNHLTNTEEYKTSAEYPKIVFLGTGSSIPHSARNVSGILIHTDENSSVLLDCGEGTYSQLLHFFGEDKLPEVLRTLKIIFVSHPHVDHHYGIVNIISARNEALQELPNNEKESHTSGQSIKNTDLLLLLPSPVCSWLESCHRHFSSVLDKSFIILNGNLEMRVGTIKGFLETAGISEIKTIRVNHCPKSFGVTFTTTLGYKITYSGDTMPSKELIEIGKDSDLLIHEATFEDHMKSMAWVKKHSTISEAIEVGQKMNAKFVLLTHFSQRYSHVPCLPDNMPENVGIAYDFMTVSKKQLPILPKLIKPLNAIFAEKLENLNYVSKKRRYRKENGLVHEHPVKVKISS